MTARTIGAICLGPCGNALGGHYFMSLVTGERISRHRWTPLPMPRDVIDRVSSIGRRQNMPSTLSFADRHGRAVHETLDDLHPDDMPDSDDEDDTYHPPSQSTHDPDTVSDPDDATAGDDDTPADDHNDDDADDDDDDAQPPASHATNPSLASQPPAGSGGASGCHRGPTGSPWGPREPRGAPETPQ